MKLIGILNLTPDSFSDGGKFNDLENAVIQTKNLIKQGANIVDVGAESTRPDAVAINSEEEWRRVAGILPEIIKVCHKNNVKVSFDSRNAENVALALTLGIDIINDVTGFSDQKMVELAVKSGKKIIVMHNLGVPARRDVIIDKNLDEIAEVKNWARTKIADLQNSGIKKENIIFDVGIGFGKDAAQSINILNNIEKFQDLGVEILVGHSRKSFLNQIEFDHNFGEDNRDNRTLFISKQLIEKGVNYLRIHDILRHRNLLIRP